MKKLIHLAVVSAALAALPASAHEVGLLVDKQFGKSLAFAVEEGRAGFKSVDPTGFGIRGAFTVLDLKVMELGITATYHPKAEADLKFDIPVIPSLNSFKYGKAGSEYMSIGVQADWKFLVNLHAGVDYRREKITSEIGGFTLPAPANEYVPYAKGSTTINRPWINAGVGFSLPMPIVSPFVRLEAAYALTTYDMPSGASWDNLNADDVRKASAARYQIALYGGVRF